jgi:flagellar biosynthesis/type III secretory pathway chaperone
MNTPWEQIADCLRAELADYGGLLHLFEEQQRSLFERNAGLVLELSTAIEGQARELATNRSRRERLVAEFAVEQGLPSTTTLRALLPRIAEDARPLLEALIDEVNRLLHRVRRTSRHNHTLLASAVQVHRETLQQLRPQAFTRTYAPSGLMSVQTASVSSSLRAAG